MTTILQSGVRNHLLAALPPEEFARLAPALLAVDLPLNLTLFPPDAPIGAVHFVETGVISMVNLMADGSYVEVGVVGREGMVGWPLLMGADTSSSEARVQMPGIALRCGAAAFLDALADGPDLRSALLRYVLAFHCMVAQTAACNARHALDQRLARWLLVAHERAEGDDLALTHESISMMLGVRRAGVSIAAKVLRDHGLIQYASGHMIVLDRPGLEAASCECHQATRRDFARQLGTGHPATGVRNRTDVGLACT